MCSGIYGNSKEDKYFESLLFKYLDEEEVDEYEEEWEEWSEVLEEEEQNG